VSPAAREPLELWGGIECTLNRVGDKFFDQAERCGHYTRGTDLNAIAALGIRTLRYPALWERIAPDGVLSANWHHCDEPLARMRELGLEPIIGLVHHGSGPAATHLLDPGFADALAAYAGAFAERYPWVRSYTPINEPLTTARFSALYGHWYPHHRNDRSFVVALLNQCRAIVQAMAAIRRVVPDARLVQTEDAGSTRGTRALAAQVAFETERRWLSLDLLTGAVTPTHPLWAYLRDTGASISDLDWLVAHAVSPDVIGLNYYVTSDRYLDDQTTRYPHATLGGNGIERYADVDATRVAGVGLRGHRAMLGEAWARYHLPLAVAEAHLGCTREEQMRWLTDAWQGASGAREDGVDVRAVTAWALLGSWDWDSLVTSRGNHYEPGAFDVRSGALRRTALAQTVSDLALKGESEHPVLAVPGWWLRTGPSERTSGRPLLIVGGDGALGRTFTLACEARGLPAIALSRHDCDITNPAAVRAAVRRYHPWAIINAAEYARIDEAERDQRECRRVNAVGPAIVAALCRANRLPLLTFSSHLVFAGSNACPYVESDPVYPQNIYGRTKAEAERRVLALNPASLVVRTGPLFGPLDRRSFLLDVLGALMSGSSFHAPSDLTMSPTYAPDMVNATLDLLIDGTHGIWHAANEGAYTWAEFAKHAARVASLDEEAVIPTAADTMSRAARRPAYSALSTERGHLLRSLDE
jgi:dTDP-4-dehydrorhamnose reductase